VSKQLGVAEIKSNQYTFSNLLFHKGYAMRAKVSQDNRGRKQVAEACLEPCSVERGMRIIGGKWTGSILWHLKDGPVRFNDLSRMIAGASKKMITERLRQLEAQGLVRRHVLQTSPVSVEYSVTELGRSALGILDDLRKWSETLPAAVVSDIG
jgi:DNA-binding HxlR family transcriptional regulator